MWSDARGGGVRGEMWHKSNLNFLGQDQNLNCNRFLSQCSCSYDLICEGLISAWLMKVCSDMQMMMICMDARWWLSNCGAKNGRELFIAKENIASKIGTRNEANPPFLSTATHPHSYLTTLKMTLDPQLYFWYCAQYLSISTNTYFFKYWNGNAVLGMLAHIS